MSSVESEYSKEINYKKQPTHNKEVGDLGFEAENVVGLFWRMIPDFKVRHSTKEEDAGIRKEEQRFGPVKMIDQVIYIKEKPSFSLQITTSTDSVTRNRKISELKNKPFIRLEEMKNDDVAIPRAVTFVKAENVAKFMKDRDFSKHPDLEREILNSTINSLKFIILQTQNPKEIERVASIIATLETEKEKLFGKSMFASGTK